MSKKFVVDLDVPASARLKLLAELTRQAKADKLANKVAVTKAYFSVSKSVKARFAAACEGSSQNEVMGDLMLKYAEQFERRRPKATAKKATEIIQSTPTPVEIFDQVPAPSARSNFDELLGEKVSDEFDLSKFYGGVK